MKSAIVVICGPSRVQTDQLSSSRYIVSLETFLPFGPDPKRSRRRRRCSAESGSLVLRPNGLFAVQPAILLERAGFLNKQPF